jgi:hypothetical protein
VDPLITTVNITVSSPTYTTGSTNGTISVTTNLAGTVYYYLRDIADSSTPVDPVALPTLITAVANNATNFIHSQSDYLNYLYTTPRFLLASSINITNITAGVPQTIPILTYMPNTSYEFCTYFNNSNGSVIITTSTCTNILTPNVAYPIYTFQLHFTSQLSRTQRNTLLCWFVNHTGAPVNLIVNLRGESCNQNGTTPSLLYYDYTNNTDQTTTKFIYLYSYDGTTPSAYTTAAANLFTGGSVGANLTAANIASLNKAVGTNLTTSQYVGNSTFSTVLGETPSVTIGAPTYTNGVISSIFTATENAIVYWAITNTSGLTVTAENILNCEATNFAKIFYNCGRAILANG